MEKIPEHGACFVCGTENPHSMGVDWYQKEDGSIHADMVFTTAHQGPPSHVHGGASAAVLDEAMGAAVWRAGYIVVAVNLEINYKKPVPLWTNYHNRGAHRRSASPKDPDHQRDALTGWQRGCDRSGNLC